MDDCHTMGDQYCEPGPSPASFDELRNAGRPTTLDGTACCSVGMDRHLDDLGQRLVMRIQLMKKIIPVGHMRLLAVVGLIPLLLNLMRSFAPNVVFGPSIFEPLWVAGFAGACTYTIWPKYDAERAARMRMTLRFHTWLFLPVASVRSDGGGINRTSTTLSTCSASMILGIYPATGLDHCRGRPFERVAGAAGYWDHFNPGLILLLPFWRICPSVELIFAIQAFCLAISGVLIGRIVLALGAGRTMASIWVLVWLLHPSVSQMNLAYTYGWHPISLAIPFLLLAALKSIRGQHSASLWSAIIACSFEETVIVIVGLFV